MTVRTSDPLNDPAWQALHAHYLAAVEQQSPKFREVLGREVGDTLRGFVKACVDELLVIASRFIAEDGPQNGLNYMIGVRVSDGIAKVTTVHAQRLGLDSVDMEAAEIDVMARPRGGKRSFPKGRTTRSDRSPRGRRPVAPCAGLATSVSRVTS